MCSGREQALRCGAAVALVVALAVPAGGAEGQTYRTTWTTSADFDSGAHSNTTASAVADQVQLDRSGTRRDQLWVANTSSDTVARMDASTGEVLSLTTLPAGSLPSRIAVDREGNAWVAVRADAGRAYKLDGATGAILGSTVVVGERARGVAVLPSGDVWVSTSTDISGSGFGWMLFDGDTLAMETGFSTTLGSYGLTHDGDGHLFTSTSWLGGQSVQRVTDAGLVEQRWRVTSFGGNVYGFAATPSGDVWGSIWANDYLIQIDGDYECPGGAADCTITVGNGVLRAVDLTPAVTAVGGSTYLGGRGVSYDASGFVWVAVNDMETTGWTSAPSYVVQVDASTGTVARAVAVGIGTVGVSLDANGYVWAVNYGGGGPGLVSLPCPGGAPAGTSTVTRVRALDGAVMGSYPTCGNGAYTYSDFTGSHLWDLVLRRGDWRAVHDSGSPGQTWAEVRWTSEEPLDTTLDVRLRAADSVAGLGGAAFVPVTNRGDPGISGRYVEVSVPMTTDRSDLEVPALLDLTVSGACVSVTETCNDFDDDCDGLVDEDNPEGGASCDTGEAGACGVGQMTCTGGALSCQQTVFAADESCNGIDDDCDGILDEGPPSDAPTWYADADGDGAGDPSATTVACSTPAGHVATGDDCDDGDATSHPGGTESCDGADNDCDGMVDEGPPSDAATWYADADGDGAGDPSVTTVACSMPSGYVASGDDCDDGDATSHPGGTESCDGADNDCDGTVDEGPPSDAPTWYADADGDGAGDPSATTVACSMPAGYVASGDDCDDSDALSLPGAEELCDGRDNDCDGSVDEDPGAEARTWYRDEDGDGFGDDDVTLAECSTPDGYVDRGGDCDDGREPVHPDADEACNGVDDDCDGETDEGFVDTDGDGTADCVDEDDDGDGVDDSEDVCPLDADPDQADGDRDGTGDACDPCPEIAGTTDAECAAGATPDAGVGADPTDEGGCGCTVPGRAGDDRPLALVGALALAAVLRRRRRRRA